MRGRQVLEFVESGKRLQVPYTVRAELPFVQPLLESCWSAAPAARPTFAQIAARCAKECAASGVVLPGRKGGGVPPAAGATPSAGARPRSLEDEAWFVPGADTAEAEQRVARSGVGVFLVRASASQPGSYTLVARGHGSVVKLPIRRYAARAVQFHPHGGQSDSVWLPARASHGGGAYVW